MEKFYSDDKLNEIANEVVKFLPSLAFFYRSEEILSEYSKRINDYKPNETHLKRQLRFKQKIKEKIQRLFSKEELKKIDIGYINDDWGVEGGIVEHHGILDDPLLLSVHLVSNFYKLLNRSEYGDIFTFATGNIPLNEPFRRSGFKLAGRKINLFPKADRDKVVYGLGKYDFDIVARLQKAHQWHTYSKEQQNFLQKITNIIKNIDFSNCKYIGDQLTKINFYLWPYLFEEKLRPNIANLISLEYDEIVIDYLIYVLNNEKESFVYQMLFNETFKQKVIQEFSGVPGAWDDERGVGSYFFWALDENNERIHLELQNGYLVGKNKNYKVPFDLKSITAELEAKRMLPGMLLKFALIMFYMGMKPFAGYSLEYLTRMKERMIKLLSEDFPEEAKLIEEIPLDNMNLISICKGSDDGKVKDLNAFDVFYQGGFGKDYFDKLDKVKFQDFMAPFLLFAYNYGLDKYGTTADKESKKSFSITEDELQKPLNKLFK